MRRGRGTATGAAPGSTMMTVLTVLLVIIVLLMALLPWLAVVALAWMRGGPTDID